MEKIKIYGGQKLCGETKIYAAKNACLPIYAATILTSEKICLHGIPRFSDVAKMEEILKHIGCKISISGGDVEINTKNADNFFIPSILAKDIRSSVFMLGSLLSRFKKAKIAYPGGCDIGSRPIDLHLKGLMSLGVKVDERHGFIECDGSGMKSGVVHLDFPSVGATENLIMASVLTKGETTIVNAAKEPEIVDLTNFINAMGGKISGAGSGTIKIEGVTTLKGCDYSPIADRIVGGTILIAGAITGGNVEISGINPEHLYSLTSKLGENGCQVDVKNDRIKLVVGARRLKSVPTIETSPYPGFPTDLQAPMLALQTVCRGTSVITENLYETRFKHVAELRKMGANITVKDRCAVVHGVKNLSGAEVFAEDLRGGASLVLAGLVASGYTTVFGVQHIDRGYYKIEEMLSSLGANIKRE